MYVLYGLYLKLLVYGSEGQRKSCPSNRHTRQNNFGEGVGLKIIVCCIWTLSSIDLIWTILEFSNSGIISQTYKNVSNYGVKVMWCITHTCNCCMRTVCLILHNFDVKSNAKLDENVLLDHIIHRTMFILALNNAENIPVSKNFIAVGVSFTHIPPPPSKNTDKWLIKGRRFGFNNTSHASYTIQCRELVPTVLTRFEPLHTNMYHIGPLDGAVLRYVFRLKIYEAISVFLISFLQKKFL